MRNSSRESGAGNYLAVHLADVPGKVVAEHSRVRVYAGDLVQEKELFPVRGYLSSVDRRLHFGLGDRQQVDSVTVRWNSGYLQTIRGPAVNRLLRITYGAETIDTVPGKGTALPVARFAESTLAAVHEGVTYDDFHTTYTLMRGRGRPGPVLARSDVDGDGAEELVMSGAAGGGLVMIDAAGQRSLIDSLPPGRHGLVTDLTFLDVDRDGDQDLYVVLGGTHLPAGHPGYQDRLYRNDGGGRFRLDTVQPPLPVAPGSCVSAGDYDGDGWTDLFVGGGVLQGSFPHASESRLLRNAAGILEDVTPAEFLQAGMVTDAVFLPGVEGKPSLVLAREWADLRQYLPGIGEWVSRPLITVDKYGKENVVPTGWWSHLNAADVDGDGDLDLVAGNLGQNAPLRPSAGSPVHLYAKDFDGNGSLDPLLFHPEADELVPFHERDLMLRQIPSMKRRFPDYHSYALARLDNVLTDADRKGSTHRTVADSRSCFLENLGDGRFRASPLPPLAQLGPVRASVFHDFTGDGRTDLFLAANLSHTEITRIGKFDGDYGTLLVRSSAGSWSVATPSDHHPMLSGEVTGLAVIEYCGQTYLAAAAVSDTLRTYRLAREANVTAR